MINGKNVFDQLIDGKFKTNENVRKLQQVKEMITQLVVCQIILILKKTIR